MTDLEQACAYAADSIEAAVAFRTRYSPDWTVGGAHPAAVEFARIALTALEPWIRADEREAVLKAEYARIAIERGKIIAAEREACARIVEKLGEEPGTQRDVDLQETVEYLADEIRARSSP